MKTSHRIAVIAAREVKRLAPHAAMRAAREAQNIRIFHPLSEAETEAILGGELLAALSGVRRHA